MAAADAMPRGSPATIPTGLKARSANLQEAFDQAMQAFEPFEQRPDCAVAVSGGADSIALALLTLRWARRRGGRMTALIVDHGLRPEAAVEVATVAAWLAARGVDSVILSWRGDKPTTGVQEAAREARYRLLLDWCRNHHVLHLLLGHHRQDQAETVVLRLGQSSGIRGLAGMASQVSTPAVRILRPLLACDPGQLRMFLSENGQGWLDDPSNADPRFARARWRAAGTVVSAAGMEGDDFRELSNRMSEARAALDHAILRLAAGSTSIDPLGFATIDMAEIRQIPFEFRLAVLSAVLSCIAGRGYPPRRRGLQRIAAWIGSESGGSNATLAACLISRRGGRVLICREGRNLPVPAPYPAGWKSEWDGRFAIHTEPSAALGECRLTITPLARTNLPMANLKQLIKRRISHVPAAAVMSLPALADRAGVVAVPPLSYWREDFASLGQRSLRIWFQPRRRIGQ